MLLRLLQPHHPHCAFAERAIALLRKRNESLTIVSQNLVEFWAVTTRPAGENGLGYTTSQAIAEVRALKSLFVVLAEVPLQEEWERIVSIHHVSGRSAHDARLVAALSVHGIRSILTFNTQDFARYPDLTVVDPRSLT